MEQEDEASRKVIDLGKFQDSEQKDDDCSAVEGEANVHVINLGFGGVFPLVGRTVHRRSV